MAWVLRAVRAVARDVPLFLDRHRFEEARSGILLWEAFVTAEAKGNTHLDDAAIAVSAFTKWFRDPASASAVTAERPLSLVGTAALWKWMDRRSGGFA
jgi:hypothetical protein